MPVGARPPHLEARASGPPRGGASRGRRWIAPLAVLLCLGAAPVSAEIGDGARRSEPITPIAPALFPPKPQAELGRRLFNDTGLSGDGSVSCASCHPLAKGGMDGRARSVGVGGQLGVINAPTVFNSALQFAQFWDARASDVRAQVDGPLLDPREMGTDWKRVIAYLESDERYRAAFKEHYDGARRIEPRHVRDAIGSFVETLVTPGSPFDRWLQGDDDALSAEQLAGYGRFKSLGCVACHQGVAVGGNMLQRFGILGDYFADRGTPIEKADMGRFNVTRDEADRHRFKVPSLRNVAVTAPYFHDGSAATLEDAVRVMIKYQLGRRATDDDIRLLVAFLESLTGEWGGQPVGGGEGR